MSALKSRSQPYLPDVLGALVEAWLADGRTTATIEEMFIEVDFADGRSDEARSGPSADA